MDKSLLMLVNPAAGRAMSNVALGSAVNAFCQEGWAPTIVYTTHPGSAREQTAALAGNFDRMICLGGDGTLSDTIAGLMELPKEKRPRLGYIPMGTANDVAATLGLPMRQPSQAAARILHGHPLWYDVGEMAGHGTFSYIAAFGAFTEVSYKTDQDLKHVLGHLAYVLEGISSLTSIRAEKAVVECGGTVTEGEFLYGAVSNSLSVAGIVKMDPRQVDLSDGLFEVLLVKKPSNPVELNSIVTGILNQNYDSRFVTLLHTDRVRFTFENPVAWTRDGENGGEHREAEFLCHPRAVEIWC